MRIDIAAQTDVGRRKRNNEDYYGVFREDYPGLQLFREGALLCVADGLGGHTGGEIASKLSVSIAKDMLKEAPPPPAEDADEDQGVLPVIRNYILKANASIFQTNQSLVTEGRPMGTTLLIAQIAPRKVYIGNVGDSRCYHIREGEILTKTSDHSWVDEQVRQGLMSKAEAEADNRKNVVTRCLGTSPEVEVDSYVWHVVPGDMLLLCTDGLVNMAKDSEIIAEFRKGGGPPDIAQRLVNLANDQGGKDNITVVVANISPSVSRLTLWRLRSMWRRRAIHLIWALISLLIGAAGFVAGLWFGGALGLE